MYMKVTARSAALARAVDFYVILPYHDGYPGAKEGWPTLYFLPGFSANAEEILFGLPMRQMSALYGIAVVVPDGENSFYTDHPERVASHGEYAGEELVRLTRQLFPGLSRKREETFIGGISMGGYGALALGLWYGETFSKIAAFSPAADPGELMGGTNPKTPGAVPGSLFGSLFGDPEAYRSNARLNPGFALKQAAEGGRPLPPIWMCCGEEDALVRESCDRFAGRMKEACAPFTYVRGQGTHDLPYWDEHLEEGFRFLAGK